MSLTSSWRENSQETVCLLSRSTKRSGIVMCKGSEMQPCSCIRIRNFSLILHFVLAPRAPFIFFHIFAGQHLSFLQVYFFFFVSPAHHIPKRIRKGTILPRRGFCLPNNPTDMLLSEALAVSECKILQRQSSTGVLEAFF